jgi:hypothetical protein
MVLLRVALMRALACAIDASRLHKASFGEQNQWKGVKAIPLSPFACIFF